MGLWLGRLGFPLLDTCKAGPACDVPSLGSCPQEQSWCASCRRENPRGTTRLVLGPVCSAPSPPLRGSGCPLGRPSFPGKQEAQEGPWCTHRPPASSSHWVHDAVLMQRLSMTMGQGITRAPGRGITGVLGRGSPGHIHPADKVTSHATARVAGLDPTPGLVVGVLPSGSFRDSDRPSPRFAGPLKTPLVMPSPHVPRDTRRPIPADTASSATSKQNALLSTGHHKTGTAAIFNTKPLPVVMTTGPKIRNAAHRRVEAELLQLPSSVPWPGPALPAQAQTANRPAFPRVAPILWGSSGDSLPQRWFWHGAAAEAPGDPHMASPSAPASRCWRFLRCLPPSGWTAHQVQSLDTQGTPVRASSLVAAPTTPGQPWVTSALLRHTWLPPPSPGLPDSSS